MKEEKKCTLSLEEEEYWLGVSWFAILRSREDDISQTIFSKFKIQGKDKYTKVSYLIESILYS